MSAKTICMICVEAAPDALREETAILDAMDDGGEVLADDVDGEQLCRRA